MRALLVVDDLFASREPALLRRLEIGLADEGVSVVHAVPEGAGAESDKGVFASAVTFPRGGPFMTRAMRARRLLSNVRAQIGGEKPAIDVVHAFGGEVWELALHIGQETGAPVLLDVWRRGLVVRARLLRSQLRASSGVVLVAPDALVAKALEQEVPGIPVKVVPWGVHRAARPRGIFQEGRGSGLFLCGGGREPAVVHAGFEGLVLATADIPDAMLFADADAAERSKLWRVAERLGVLDRLSLVPEMERQRELVIRGDLILQPESHGEQRSLLLDAMGQGMVVAAGEDPDVSWLLAGRTAAILERAHEPTSPDAWRDVLRPFLTDPLAARRLGESAWQYVGANHRASTHIARVLDAYEWAISPDRIEFTGSAPRD